MYMIVINGQNSYKMRYKEQIEKWRENWSLFILKLRKYRHCHGKRIGDLTFFFRNTVLCAHNKQTISMYHTLLILGTGFVKRYEESRHYFTLNQTLRYAHPFTIIKKRIIAVICS